MGPNYAEKIEADANEPVVHELVVDDQCFVVDHLGHIARDGDEDLAKKQWSRSA